MQMENTNIFNVAKTKPLITLIINYGDNVWNETKRKRNKLTYTQNINYQRMNKMENSFQHDIII